MYLIHSLPKRVRILLTSPYPNIHLAITLFSFYSSTSVYVVHCYYFLILVLYSISTVILCLHFMSVCTMSVLSSALEAGVVKSNSLCVEAYGNKVISDSNSVKSTKSVKYEECP